MGLPHVKKFIHSQSDNNLGENSEIRTPENLTDNWFNLYDLLDPVAINPVLEKVFKPNTSAVCPNDEVVTNDYCIDEKDKPHQSYGYLRTEKLAQIVHDFIMTDEPNRNIKLMIFKHKLKGILNSIVQFFISLFKQKEPE